MKHLSKILILFFASGLTTIFAQSVQASTIAGNQSQTVCWTGRPQDVKHQVLFGEKGQGFTHAIPDLSANSRCVSINYLKSCTTYEWNTNSLSDGIWKFEYGQNQTFTTACSNTVIGQTFTPKVKGVTTTNQNQQSGYQSAIASWQTTNSASYYNVYYRKSTDPIYKTAIRVPAKSTKVTINFLDPNTTYFYKVATVIDGREYFQNEQILISAGVSSQFNKPKVAGLSTTNSKLVKKGIAHISWTNNKIVNTYHVYYRSNLSNTYQYALRDLSNNSRSVNIGYLNPSLTYFYRVQAINNDGTTSWLNPEMQMNVE